MLLSHLMRMPFSPEVHSFQPTKRTADTFSQVSWTAICTTVRQVPSLSPVSGMSSQHTGITGLSQILLVAR